MEKIIQFKHVVNKRKEHFLNIRVSPPKHICGMNENYAPLKKVRIIPGLNLQMVYF